MLVQVGAVGGQQGLRVEGAGLGLVQPGGGAGGRGGEGGRVAAGEQDTAGSLLQLAHVAGPGVAGAGAFGQGGPHFGGELGRVVPGEPLDQGAQQQVQFGRILTQPLAQGRHHDHVGAEPVEEVVAEAALAPQLVQRAIGGGDDPPGEALRLVAAHRGEGALLQHVQQFDLHRHRHVADLVQEDGAVGAAAGQHALVVLDRAGEGALAVAEQLRLDQRFGKLR